MTAHWRSRTGLFLVMLGAAALPGCVERRYTVLTDPPSAMVFEDGRPRGPSPTNQTFDYYGVRKYTVMRDGFQTLEVYEDLRAPWWEYPPFDFITENLLPWTLRDFRELRFTLLPPPVVPAEQVKDKALQLRERGLQLVPPMPPVPEGPPPRVLPPAEEGPRPQVLPPVPEVAPKVLPPPS